MGDIYICNITFSSHNGNHSLCLVRRTGIQDSFHSSSNEGFYHFFTKAQESLQLHWSLNSFEVAPSSQQNIKNPICSIEASLVNLVGYHPDFESSRCLFIVRTDGEMVDFSYWKCIKGFLILAFPYVDFASSD
ncbi:hypothetical protein CTI12_AA367090 [Artemisia annua]|uniref:Uncharacterized protein n=1 Tax=Artemisia annua TaxID=35608 RepID=A0A2U1MLI6_ARTAN|nr:hypothetical protein CTI12_AA367090 [Artemisia annua]